MLLFSETVKRSEHWMQLVVRFWSFEHLPKPKVEDYVLSTVASQQEGPLFESRSALTSQSVLGLPWLW